MRVLPRTKNYPRFVALTVVSSAVVVLAGCHSVAGAPGISTASGLYRLPYEDGTEVKVTHGFEEHVPPGRYDLRGTSQAEPHRIVAAADGWVRFIVDSNENKAEQPRRNNYVWIEHPYPFCQGNHTWPGKPEDYDQTCIPCETRAENGATSCNEWTKYSHMRTGSATGEAGLSVGDWITAGTFVGLEGDVGLATAVHLHWEVNWLDPDAPLSDPSGGWAAVPFWADESWTFAPNLLPTVCRVGELADDAHYTADDCSRRAWRRHLRRIKKRLGSAPGRPTRAAPPRR